jgi:YHS domain-containing protein
MMKRFFTAVLGAGLLLSPLPAFAAADAVYTNWRDNIAADGYDVVTFFAGKPQPGKTEFTTRYEGADWFFFSQANKDLFLTNPDLFAPQYGGYCAWAVAKGKLAPGSPDHWHVEDGRLFFNYNARVERRWQKKRAKFIREADGRWPDLIGD